MMDAVRKQTELSKRVLAGTATDADRNELASLTEKLDSATAAKGDPRTVNAELTTMDAAEFEKFLADEQATLAKAPDLDRLALLRENVAAVRKQAGNGRTIYAVRVPVIEKIDPMDAILKRLDEMEKKFDARFRTGVGHPTERPAPAPAAEVAPVVEAAPAAPAPVVEQQKDALSKDAIDAVLTLSSVDELMAAIGALTAKAADEADESDELRKLLDGTYDLAHLVTCAATIAQKAADLVEAAQALEKAKATRTAKPLAPPFKPADEASPNGSPETDLDEDEADETKGCGPDGKKKPAMAKAEEPTPELEPVEAATVEPEDVDAEASDDVTKFAWSEDLSPDNQPVGERFRAFKRACSSRPS